MHFNSPQRSRHLHGFSITELLVVIGIIVLLIGILLPALGKAREKALVTSTRATMEEFAKAADAFHAEFGVYPGVVPEAILASDPQISGTENALLHLMGGFGRREDFAPGGAGNTDFNAAFPTSEWDDISFNGGAYIIRVNKRMIGQGPIVNGRQYPPFFSPKGDEFAAAPGQNLDTVDGDPFSDDPLQLPDLLDSWGNPIIYVRQTRSVGPLVGAVDGAQFSRGSMSPYLDSRALGESGKDQDNSILMAAPAGNRDATFAQIIRNEAFGSPSNPLTGTSRGAYVLISAGPDGIFFSQFDGKGTNGDPVTDIITPGPKAVQDFDDIRVFGGG